MLCREIVVRVFLDWPGFNPFPIPGFSVVHLIVRLKDVPHSVYQVIDRVAVSNQKNQKQIKNVSGPGAPSDDLSASLPL